MKQPESNSLRKELAWSQQAGAHPDSDVLSAFAEGSLLARERESVLEHLALCVQCREVLHIAANAAPDLVAEAQPKPLLRPVHPPLRSWLPWVAVAAAVLVVSSALLLHETKKQAGGASSVESARMANTEAPQAPPAAAQLPPASEARAYALANNSPARRKLDRCPGERRSASSSTVAEAQSSGDPAPS